MGTTEEKYLTSLNELYSVLKYTEKISLSKFITDNNLSKNFAIVLKNGGIISTNGLRAQGTRYKWTTQKPTIGMAKEVIVRVNDLGSCATQKKRESDKAKNQNGIVDNTEKKHKRREVKHLKSYTTSLFFGLIKIKTVLNY